MRTQPSRWFVSENRLGFANSWDVLVFTHRTDRNAYVDQWHDHWDGQNSWEVLAIRKTEAAEYAANLNITTGKRYRPQPFSGEYWGIVDDGQHSAPGCIGVLTVCALDSGEERLWGTHENP